MGRRSSLFWTVNLFLICTPSIDALDVQGYRIALPADCNVAVRWVCPPFDPNRLEQAQWSGKDEGGFHVQLDVDAAGNPWFALRRGYKTQGQILNPLRQYHFGLSHPFEGMACLDNGALLFHTDHDLGFIRAPETAPLTKDGLPILPFQPAVALPRPGCRVYAGANNAVYIVGPADNGDQEVYLLQPEALSQDGQKIVRSLRKVFTTSSERIGAVTGDGQTTFVALGRTIARIRHDRQAPPDLLLHPAEDITSLAYSSKAGLFYTTDSAVGVVGDMGAWDFLPLEWAQIAVRGESLYVCLWDTWGVIAMDHVSELARYARDVPYTLQPPKSPSVEVTGIRFRASSRDPNDEGMTGQEFERTKVQEIQGLMDMHPVGPQATPTVLTVRWSGPMDLREDGYRTHRRTWHGIIDFSDGKDRQGQFQAPFEETFYPGRYTLKILINGDESDSGSFTLTGRTTVLEAALQNDVPLLKTLLEQGADPNERDGQGQTALFVAAFCGSTEAAELLLQHGAQVNARDDQGQTPLFHVALGYDGNPTGALDTARLLIRHGADVSAKDKESHDVLDCYFHWMRADLADVLFRHGLEVDAKDNEGYTRLAGVVRSADGRAEAELAECLLRHGADITATNNGGEGILYTALYSDRVEGVRVLLEHGANPNTPSIDKSGNKRFPLPFAASMHPDHGPLIELLLSHGADPDVENYPGGTALAWVLDAAEPDSARVLLKHGASLTADCRVENQIGSPLRGALASYLSNEPKDRVKAQKAKDIFFMLLEHGARLRAQEEPIVADKRLHGWLPQDFILEVLKRNDQAVLEARDLTDPLLQGVVISRLLDRARAKTAAATSKVDYQAALALCDQAKTRAQVWGIESRCPLIYYNTGLLYGQLGEIEAAKDNFRRYLALAPGAQDAEAIRKSFGL